MATKRLLTLPTITGIVPGSASGTVGTLNLPLEYRYAKIQLVIVDTAANTNNILTYLGDIAIFRNTKQQRLHSAAELDHLNSINASTGGTQYSHAKQTSLTGTGIRDTLDINFYEPWRTAYADGDSGCWNVTAATGWQTFQVQITLIAALLSTMSIVAYAWVDDPVTVPAGTQQTVKKVYRQQIPASGTGNDFTGLDARDSYQTIALKNPTGTYIKDVSFKYNGVPVLDTVFAEDNFAHLVGMDMNPSLSSTAGAFAYDIVFDADDSLNNVLPSANQALWLHMDYNAAASGNVVALIERYGPFD